MENNVITQEMVDCLNKELLKMDCHFKYILVDKVCIAREIIDNNNYVTRAIICCTEKFQNWLTKFFKDNYNISLTHGSSGTISFIKDMT